MPRTADHEARRRQFAAAVRALARHEGLHRVTVARVAQQAGVSVGLVQHYFPTKQALLVHSYDTDLEATWARVERLRRDGDRSRERIETTLRRCLAELLPLDRARREEAVARQAFAALACHDPDLAQVHRRAQLRIVAAVRDALVNAQGCGEATDAGPDPAARAAELLAGVDGLTGLVLSDVLDAPTAEAILHSRLAALLPGQCRHWADTEPTPGPAPGPAR